MRTWSNQTGEGKLGKLLALDLLHVMIVETIMSGCPCNLPLGQHPTHICIASAIAA